MDEDLIRTGGRCAGDRETLGAKAGRDVGVEVAAGVEVRMRVKRFVAMPIADVKIDIAPSETSFRI